MADVEMRFGADASKVVNEYDKVVNAEKKWQREVEATSRQINRREQQMQQAMAKHQASLNDLEKQGTLTYGSMLVKIGALAAATKAWSVVTEHALQVHKDAAQRQRNDAIGIGSLGQLAESEADLKRMYGEASALRRGGAAASMTEAAKMVFQFESGKLGAGDRTSIANLRKWNVISDASSVAESLTTLRSAMGAGETGSFNQMISKGFAAAGPTPGEFQELMTSTAQVAPAAKLAGWSDEQLLAVMGVLTKATGKPDRAEPLATELLKSISEKPGLIGKSIPHAIRDIQALGMNEPELRAFLGGRGKALSAYQILSGKEGSDLFGELTGKIAGATNADLGGQKARFNASIPAIRAAVAMQEAEGRADQATTDIGVSQLMFEAELKKHDTGTILGSAGRKAEEFARWFGVSADALGQDWGDLFGPGRRARQEAALTASLPQVQAGPAVAPDSRPYSRANLVVPQLPETEDPRVVGIEAQIAQAQKLRIEWERANFDRFAGSDKSMSPREEARMNRDVEGRRLASAIDRLNIELRNIQADRRIRAGSGLNGGQPR
jgi:hypothetical protein